MLLLEDKFFWGGKAPKHISTICKTSWPNLIARIFFWGGGVEGKSVFSGSYLLMTWNNTSKSWLNIIQLFINSRASSGESGESFLFGTGICFNHFNLKWLKEEWAVHCMVWGILAVKFPDVQACHFSFLEGDYETILLCLQYWPSKLLVYAFFGVTDKSLKPH